MDENQRRIIFFFPVLCVFCPNTGRGLAGDSVPDRICVRPLQAAIYRLELGCCTKRTYFLRCHLFVFPGGSLRVGTDDLFAGSGVFFPAKKDRVFSFGGLQHDSFLVGRSVLSRS